MFVNDRSEIDTTRCRLSRVQCRMEAGARAGSLCGQPYMQADLSGREKVEFTAILNCSDTHYSEELG